MVKPAHTAVRSVKNLLNAARGIPAVILANLLLTRRCTQNCLQCSIPQEQGNPPFMNMDDFTFLIDRFDRHGTQFISLSGGEPVLHPQIDECLRYAACKKFAHVQLLSTLYASQAVVGKTIDTLMKTGAGIQVSFDGFDETADIIRGAKNVSDTVRHGMDIITRENKKRRKPIRTSANIVISRLNLHQVPDILSYIEGLGWKCNIDLYRWTSANTIEEERMKLRNDRELGNVIERIKRSPSVTTPGVIIDGFTDYLDGNAPKRCPYLDSKGFGTKIYINPDCSVSVCIGEPFGNLREQTLTGLFRSDAWESSITEMKSCKGCWNSCYTPSGIVFHPTGFKDIKAIWGIMRRG